MNILYKLLTLALVTRGLNGLRKIKGLYAGSDQSAPSSKVRRTPKRAEAKYSSWKSDGAAPEVWVWMLLDDSLPSPLRTLLLNAERDVVHAHQRSQIRQRNLHRGRAVSVERRNRDEMPERRWLSGNR